MTLRDAVRVAVSQLAGNRTFGIEDVADYVDNIADRPDHSRDSLSRAIRETNGVQRVGIGKYRIRGRRVIQE